MDSVCDRKLRKSTKPLMLKDYLMDDQSSCSSNGFKSFPRRQCCTTVRFLLESDLKKPNNTKRHLKRSRYRAASTTISALQRASVAVINVVKHFPFPSVKSPSRRRLLPRSVSRKLLRRSFRKKTEKDDESNIGRSRLFHEFLREHDKPSDQNTSTTTVIIPRLSSTSTSSNSWAESEFTSDILPSSSGNSECSTGNDVVVVADSEKDLSEKVNKKVDITVGDDSMECSATANCSFQNSKGWPNEEEKEQFSPVSVLDCPFEDEDEATSPFRRDLALIDGTKQKPVHKIRRFENLRQLKPVDLDKRMALMTELEDETPVSSVDSNSLSLQNTICSANHDQEIDDKARELVKMIFKTTTTPSNTLVFKAENLMFDFFRESIVEEYHKNAMEELLKVAEDWIHGKPQEVLLGWEVKEGRNGYVKDMEKGGKWRKLDEEKEEVGLELEIEVWNTLLKELLFDLL
ncbi:uncharacterized protein LOC107434890 [Ziziphus jujuba]|uniref:Uncharacterized protein LOC107434890 n=2 Tax=Ziziphus jujuba TaxID=326968 RepID=A0A6P4BG14_ZIZJJ|nr:uncharacterized protein LOC107434890 [Ziziphus jujuba]KAH7514022.1 hypothetical protein FEM48_Zijuj11G0044500 [Ziziphus jujuba var. spinosa]